MSTDEAIGVADPSDTPAPRTVDDLYHALRGRILRCEMRPGSQISQVQLARTLGVHRSALREALRMLQREGLIEGEYNRRVRIAPLSSTQLEQLYALRIVEESLALRLSVPRFSDAQLDRLEWLRGAMEAHADPSDFASRQAFHTEFHALLVSEAGERIGRSARELQDHCARYRRALVEDRPLSTFAIATKEHAAIVVACRERTADVAVATLAKHLARAALSLSSISDPAHDPVAVREALHSLVGVRG